MKLAEVQVGGRYTCKVSGRVVTVQVASIDEVELYRGRDHRGRAAHQVKARNLETGREIVIRSPQRLRSRVDDGCEFCRQAFNRPDGAFTCPYCHKAWTGQEVRR